MFDVVVVGGGVIGLACAAELATAGAAVTVLEGAQAVGQGSSARANGGFRAQFSTAPNISFSRFSIAAFEAMHADDEPIEMHQTGYLLITGSEEGGRSLRAAHDLQRSLGVATEWLGAEEVGALAPFVRLDGIQAGTFHARDGFLDPSGVVSVLARRAVAAGASIETGAGVTAITAGTRGFQVEHVGGGLEARVVVNAAGPDARAIARLAGSDVPVEPIRRNLALALAGPQPLTPMVVDLDTGVLVRRESAGGWVLCYANPDDRPGRETQVDPRFFEDLARLLPNRFPFVLDLPMDPARCWAGLYPETPDHHAIVGEDPTVPGLLHCVGFGGHGVMHAPAAGRAIRELILEGESETFDLHPLRPTRFAEQDLVVETAVF